MTSRSVRFDRFTLDADERQLRCEGVTVAISVRCFDALVLLVQEAGSLVSKDRFLDEVWCGVPVTDEALTQCIKTLRRALGDDAARPRFIETVAKHGYRFIAAIDVEVVAPTPLPARQSLRDFLRTGGAGMIGAGVAGIAGGLLYGFIGAQAIPPGTGGASVLLVILWLAAAVALMGGAGVSFGIAAASFVGGGAWRIAGGALGGLIVGGAVKLLGLDAFNLLLGRSPEGVTGAPEGALLGGAVGLGAWLARHGAWPRRLAIAGACGGMGGALVVLLGGRMLAGSLDVLTQTFPHSRLRLDAGGLEVLAAGLEGALFSIGIVGTMLLRRARGMIDADAPRPLKAALKGDRA